MPKPSQNIEHTECVIVLHGLGRTARAMNKLAGNLGRDYQVINTNYPSRKQSIEELAEDAISKALLKCDKAEKVNFVTHSMGGILVRQYMQNNTIENIGRTVMLGPPNQGSELADFFANNPLFTYYNGPAGKQLGTGESSLPIKLGKVDFEVGVIAGNKNYNPAFAKLTPGEHDGKVSVARSEVEGMSDHLVMPVTHTFMMQNDAVIEQVRYFLNYGEFNRPEKEKTVD